MKQLKILQLIPVLLAFFTMGLWITKKHTDNTLLDR